MKVLGLAWALLLTALAVACNSSEDASSSNDAGSVPGAACQSDAECDDGQACNGSETCVAGYCTLPTDCVDQDCAVDNGGCPYTAMCSVGTMGVVCTCKPGFQGADCNASWEHFDALTVPSLGSGIDYLGSLGNRIYFANSVAADAGASAMFLSYDVVTKELSTETPNADAFPNLDGPGGSSFPIAVDGALYCLAADGLRYDLATKVWSKTAFDPMVNARDRPAAALLNGKIYEVGSADFTDVVQAYDPVSDTWSAPGSIANAPWKVGFAVAAASGGKLYVIGREKTSSPEKGVFAVYDPSTNAWTTKPDVDAPKSSKVTPYFEPSGAVTVNDKIYVDFRYSILVYDPAADAWGEPMVAPTGGLYGGAMVTVNGDLFVLRGKETGVDVFRYDL